MQCRWGVWHGFNRHNGGMIWESFVASQFLCSRFSEYRILRCRGPALSEGKSQWSEQSALLQCELFEGGRYEWVGAVPRSRSVCVCVCVCVCACGWMRRVRFIPTGKGGLGLRLNLTLWQLVLTWTVPPVGHLPFTHTHTHTPGDCTLPPARFYTRTTNTWGGKGEYTFDADTREKRESRDISLGFISPVWWIEK